MTTKKVDQTTEIRAIQLSLSKLEQLGNQRATFMLLVEADIKAIDETRKAERTSLADRIKGLKDVTLAVAVVNVIAPRIKGADEVTRKRLQRRRNWLKSSLKDSYPLYDFAVEPGKNSRGVMASFIGDAFTRQAIDMLETVKASCKLAGISVPKKLTVTGMAMKLKEAHENRDVVGMADFGPTASVKPLDLSAVASKVKSMTVPAAVPSQRQAATKKKVAASAG